MGLLGLLGLQGLAQEHAVRGAVAAENAAKKAMDNGLRSVEVYVKGPGSGREAAIRSLQAVGLEIRITVMSPRFRTTAAVRPSAVAFDPRLI